jgi:long-subunit fatty acid transport protein
MHKKVIVFMLTASPAMSQQGGEIIGESPLSAGTAGASLGSGQSVLDASSNPSTLILVFENLRNQRSEHRLEAALRAVHYNTEMVTSKGQNLALDLPMGIGPWLGYASAIGSNGAWGINFQPTVAGNFSTVRNTTLNLVREDPFDPDSPLVESMVPQTSSLLQLALEPTWSVRVSDQLALGVGASIRNTVFEMRSATEVSFDTLQGSFDVGIPGFDTWADFFTSPAIGGEGGGFQTSFNASASSSVPTVFLKLGATYSTPKGGSIGAWFRPESTPTDMEGHIDVDMRDDLGVFIDVLEDEGISLGINEELTSGYDLRIADISFPAQIGFSYSSPSKDDTRWHGKAVYTQWSKALSGWVAGLTNPTNPEFIDFIGGDGSINIDMGMQWRDTLAISIGYEKDFSFDITKWGDEYKKIHEYTFRGGIGWSNNPVAGSAMGGLTPYNKLHLAIGFSAWSSASNPLDTHMGFVFTLPEKWTSGESTFLSDQSYDEYSQYGYSFVIGGVYSF